MERGKGSGIGLSLRDAVEWKEEGQWYRLDNYMSFLW